MKKIVLALVLVALAAGAYTIFSNRQTPPAQPREVPPVAVGIMSLHKETVRLTQRLNGRIVPLLVAEVRPQVSGIIRERFFEEGQNVSENAPLYQIDPAMYEAELKEAQAGLAQAQADRQAADSRLSRYEALLNNRAINRQEYEDVEVAFNVAEAAVSLAEARLQIARINFDRTVIVSPIDGRVGISDVTQGALVTDGQQAPLTVVQRLDPVYVDIHQPIRWILDARETMQSESIDVRLLLPNGKEYEHGGTIFFADAIVDQSTGTVNLRAEFPNPDLVLLPGMYVRAQVKVGEITDAILVPQRALFRENDGSAYVILARENGTAEKRTVRAERVHEGKWVIEHDLDDDETIVVDGIQRLRFLAGGPAPRITIVNSDDTALAQIQRAR